MHTKVRRVRRRNQVTVAGQGVRTVVRPLRIDAEIARPDHQKIAVPAGLVPGTGEALSQSSLVESVNA